MAKSDAYRTLIQREFETRCRKNAAYSLRSFARTLVISPGALSQILSGKRIPSLKTAQGLLKRLGLSQDDEQTFLGSLAQRQKSRGLSRISPAIRKLASQWMPEQKVEIDDFEILSEWYHFAIFELTQVEGFQSDAAWIARVLDLPQPVVQSGIERLIRAGLLVEAEGVLRRSSQSLSVGTASPSKTHAALRSYHRQILERAIRSLDQDPVEERCMRSLTVAVDPEQLPLAKEMIRDFVRSLAGALETGRPKRVYQLGVALYPAQKAGADS